jgi:hypothetical protein
VAQADPMQDLLKQLKAEVQARKDAERATADLTKELRAEADTARKAATALGLVSGAMSSLGSGKVASLGTGLGSLVSHFQGFGKLEGAGAKAGSVLNMIGAGKQALGSLAGIVKSVGSVASVAGLALGGVGAAVGGLTGSLTAPLDAIKSTVDAISQFVQLANPGVFLQFTRAMDDAMAVLGGMLTPVLEGLTVYVRTYADALARLGPVLQPLFDEFGQLFADMALIGAQMLEAYAPLIQLLADGLIPVIRKLAEGFAFVEGAIIQLVNTFTSLLGLTSRFDKGKNSQGAAVRGIHTGSVDDFAKRQFEKMIEGAFSSGKGKTPQQVNEEILKALERGKELMGNLTRAIEALVQWLRERGKDVERGQAVGEGATRGIGGSAFDQFLNWMRAHTLG